MNRKTDGQGIRKGEGKVTEHQENNNQIANMSKLDFLTLLWEARIVGSDYVYAKMDA